MTSAGNPSGKTGNGRSRTSPISSQWPVTESLPGRRLGHPAERAARRRLGPPRRRRTRPAPVRGGAASAGAVRTLPGDVAERVAALVAVGGGVGQLADADAIENDEDDAAGRRRSCSESAVSYQLGLSAFSTGYSGLVAGVVVADRPRRPDRRDRVLEDHVIGAALFDDDGETIEVLDPPSKSVPSIRRICTGSFSRRA